VYELGSRQIRSITDMRAHHVRWTPDGRHLLVTAPSPGNDARWVWLVPLDGGLPEPLVRGNAQWGWPDQSPVDGRLLATRCGSDDGCELVVLDPETGSERVLHTATELRSTRWSPDGEWVAWSGAYRPVDSASAGVWVAPATGGSVRRLASDGSWIVWEPGSRALVFARYEEHAGLWRVPLEGGDPTRLPVEWDEGMWDYFVAGLELAADGSTLVVRVETAITSLYMLEEPAD
jgi:Tol biopolymer transport system component